MQLPVAPAVVRLHHSPVRAMLSAAAAASWWPQRLPRRCGPPTSTRGFPSPRLAIPLPRYHFCFSLRGPSSFCSPSAIARQHRPSPQQPTLRPMRYLVTRRLPPKCSVRDVHFVRARRRFPPGIEVPQLLVLNAPILNFAQAHWLPLAKSSPVFRMQISVCSPGHLRFPWRLAEVHCDISEAAKKRSYPFLLTLCAPPAPRF